MNEPKVTICKPSRRYKNVSLTSHKNVKQRDMVNSKVFTWNEQFISALDRVIDNRSFNNQTN